MVSPVGFVPKSPTLDPDEVCLVITRVMGLKLMSAGLHRALEEVFMSLDTQHRRESAPVPQNNTMLVVNQQDWLRDMISFSGLNSLDIFALALWQ